MKQLGTQVAAHPGCRGDWGRACRPRSSDCSDGTWEILREGAIPVAEIRAAAGLESFRDFLTLISTKHPETAE